MILNNLSASRINTFEKCQLEYHATYELKLPETVHPLTVMGTTLHEMFELATNGRLAGGSDEAGDPFSMLDGVAARNKMDEDLKPLLRTLTGNAIKWGYFRNIRYTKGVEVKFEFEIPDGTLVRGIIDRLDIFGLTADIIDLKTQKRAFDQKTLHLKWQPRIYNVAARKLHLSVTDKVSVSMWVLRHQVQRVSLTAADADKTVDDLMGVAERIRSCTDPEPTPSALCPWCCYYSQCTAAKERPPLKRWTKK